MARESMLEGFDSDPPVFERNAGNLSRKRCIESHAGLVRLTSHPTLGAQQKLLRNF